MLQRYAVYTHAGEDFCVVNSLSSFCPTGLLLFPVYLFTGYEGFAMRNLYSSRQGVRLSFAVRPRVGKEVFGHAEFILMPAKSNVGVAIYPLAG